LLFKLSPDLEQSKEESTILLGIALEGCMIIVVYLPMNFQFYSGYIGTTSADKSKEIKSNQSFRQAGTDSYLESREKNFTHRGKHQDKNQLIQAKMYKLNEYYFNTNHKSDYS